MITVIGSVNMDLVIQTDIFPQQGETVLGQQFTTTPGGKGANQAVAAARLNAPVQMIAAVGKDAFGEALVQNLNEQNVQTTNIFTSETAPSGIANILLSEGDNRIIVVPGANYTLSSDQILSIRDVIQQSKLVVMQLEIPIPTIDQVLTLCEQIQVPVLLNPAPAAGFSLDFMDRITYLTPNETECAQIFGADIEAALERYPNQVIVTLGAAGARYYDGEKHIFVDGFPTTVQDTTGAGDTFNGALATRIVAGDDLEEAVRFANAAGSLSVEKFGAQGGMPTDAMVEIRLREMS